MKQLLILMLILWSQLSFPQFSKDISGQQIISGQYGYDEEHFGQVALQMKADFNAEYRIDSSRFVDFEFSGIASGNMFIPYNFGPANIDVFAYRLWVRYAAPQWQVTAGLQKIDFGSASILRPLQWFNEIDPRDPIGLTRGVNGVVGRYVFLNNANIWLWGLYGNERRRGLDAEASTGGVEFGGRLQLPMPKGEVAFTYHHRDTDLRTLGLPFELVPEHKFGIDGKWDLGIGLWSELVFSMKQESVGLLTYQKYCNIGVDYTFGLGNGLNMMLENLLIALDPDPLGFQETVNLTALTAAYSLGFYDAIQLIAYYSWANNSPIVAFQYSHDFPRFSSYIIAFYNPPATNGVVNNDLAVLSSGPGVRLLLNFNN